MRNCDPTSLNCGREYRKGAPPGFKLVKSCATCKHYANGTMRFPPNCKAYAPPMPDPCREVKAYANWCYEHLYIVGKEGWCPGWEGSPIWTGNPDMQKEDGEGEGTTA